MFLGLCQSVTCRYDQAFRTLYTSGIQEALFCQSCWVNIISITPGSIIVETEVIYPDGISDDEDGSQAIEMPVNGLDLVAILATKPQDLFTPDFLNTYDMPSPVNYENILLTNSPQSSGIPPPQPPLPEAPPSSGEAVPTSGGACFIPSLWQERSPAHHHVARVLSSMNRVDGAVALLELPMQ